VDDDDENNDDDDGDEVEDEEAEDEEDEESQAEIYGMLIRYNCEVMSKSARCCHFHQRNHLLPLHFSKILAGFKHVFRANFRKHFHHHVDFEPKCSSCSLFFEFCVDQ
jgi:hypothetical protein